MHFLEVFLYLFMAKPAFSAWCLFGAFASFIIGLNIGSFLNVLIYRTSETLLHPDKKLTVSHPRGSFCPSCNTNLRWYHNIPVFSWLFLGGKCAFCKAPIGAKYPLTELVTAILFTFWYTHSTNLHILFSGWIFYFLLLAYISIYYRTGIIPPGLCLKGAGIIFALDLAELGFDFSAAIYPLVFGAIGYSLGCLIGTYTQSLLPNDPIATVDTPAESDGQLLLPTRRPFSSSVVLDVSTPLFLSMGFLDPEFLLFLCVFLGSVVTGVANLPFVY